MKLFRSLFTFFALGLVAAGCGSGSNTAPAATAPGSQATAPTIDPLVNSIPDDCLIETFVGPFRGYELPYVKNGVWSDSFNYTSGLGEEVVSGFNMHRSGEKGPPNPVCEELSRMLMAAPVTDEPTEKRTYALDFAIEATAPGFPLTLQEARGVDHLAANMNAALKISVLQPCTQPWETQCWEHLADHTLTADFSCATSNIVERSVPAEKLTDTDDDFDFRKAYHVQFPDGCAFRIVNAVFVLANGQTIRASIAGTASTEPSGPRLRILRISPTQ